MRVPIIYFIILSFPVLFHSDIAMSINNNISTYEFDYVKANLGWEVATGSGVIIAIIDSGFQLDHPSYRDFLWSNPNEIALNGIDDDNNGYIDDYFGWDFAYNDKNVDDNDGTFLTGGHGTQMAGIVHSFAPNATIMPIKFLDSSESYVPSDTVTKLPDAIRYAVDNGASTILFAFGRSEQMSNNTVAAFDFALSNNVTLVSVTGNIDRNSLFYPAKYDQTLAIGAINSQKLRSTDWSNNGGSNWGYGIDAVAPGDDILTSDLGSSLVCVSGTSVSGAIVTALVPLIYEVRSNITPSEIRSLIANTAQDVGVSGYDLEYGNGIVDFAQSVRVVNDIFTPILVSSTSYMFPTDEYNGYLGLELTVREDSIISRCDLTFKTKNSGWSEYSFCSMVYMNNTIDEITFNINLSISGSLIYYYITVYDILDHSLSIGTKTNPVLVITNLKDIPIMTSTFSTSEDFSSSSSISFNTSNPSSKENSFSSAGDWYQRSSVATSNFYFTFLILPSFIFFRKLRKK